MTPTTIIAQIDEFLWKKDLSLLPKWQAWLVHLLRIFQAVIRDLAGGLPTLRAMSLVYTTLLSLVPLLAVSFSVLKGFGVHNKIEPTLLHLLAPLGEQGVTITQQILGFVDNIKVGLLGFFGILLLFYTVITLIQKIERAFNATWRISEFRSLSQRFSDYLSVVMVGPVLVFTAIGITATISSSAVINALAAMEPFGSLIHIIGSLLPYVLVIVAFTFIYTLIPNTKVNFRSALTGAVIAGILWETAGWIFAIFISNSANSSTTAIYSGFAVLIFFMIWLYLSWMILLIGASIAFYHQHPEQISSRQQELNLSGRIREKLALILMYKIGKSFHTGEKAWTLDQLAGQLDLSTTALSSVLDALESASLIIRSSDKKTTYLPNQSLENISIKIILDVVRAAEETPSLNFSALDSNNAIDSLLTATDKAVVSALHEYSLYDMVTDSIK